MTDSSRAMLIQEAATYNFDGSCCCYKNEEETVVSSSTYSIARRFGCCCFVHNDHTVINMDKVALTKIEQPAGGCAFFWTWFMFGCFGWHRFLAGRYKSAFAMAIVFSLSFAGVLTCFISAEEILWNHDWNHDHGLWINAHTWYIVGGIFSSIIFALVFCLWIWDAFFLLRWSQYVDKNRLFSDSGKPFFKSGWLLQKMIHSAMPRIDN